MKILKIVLWLPVAFMAYVVYNSIMAPIEFEKVKETRYTAAIGHLIDIRKSQLAYKSVNGDFAKSWDGLVQFIDTAEFTLISRRDTSYMAYNKVYRMDMLTEEVIVDTLGVVSVKDSLFPKAPSYRKMMEVPNTDGLKFELKTSSLDKNGIKVPVFVARVTKKEILDGLDTQLIQEAIDAFDVKGNYLQVGDLESANVSGNWPKYLEPNFRSAHK